MAWCARLFGAATLLHSKTKPSDTSNAAGSVVSAADRDGDSAAEAASRDAAANEAATPNLNYVHLSDPNVAVETLSKHKIVMLYFSASWCPPCKRFTPLLANLHRDVLKQEQQPNQEPTGIATSSSTTVGTPSALEIVFISLDESLDDFRSYYTHQHGNWLALPFEEAQRRRKLIRKFKIRQIPTLVVLDGATGRVLNKNAVKEASKDKALEQYPFLEKNVLDVLKDGALVKADGSILQSDELKKMPAFCLYFGGQWSPPCRAFTPVLVSIYHQLKENPSRCNTEFIYVSSDKDSTAYEDASQLMPFARVAFQDPIVNALRSLCHVQALPALIVCDATGAIIQSDARQAAADDPNAQRYPWVPEPLPVVSDLVASDQVIQALNETVCFTLHLNGAANGAAIKEEYRKAATAAMQQQYGNTTVGGAVSGKAALRKYRNPFLEPTVRSTADDAAAEDDAASLPEIHFFVTPAVDAASMLDRVVAAVGAETPGAGLGPFVLATFLSSDVEHMATKRETLTGDLNATTIGAMIESFLARHQKAEAPAPTAAAAAAS